MRRIGWLAALALLSAPCCNRDINDQDVRIAVTSRVSLNSAGQANNLACSDPAVSADGRFIVFVSNAGNLTPTTGNGFTQIYLRDLTTGLTELISVDDAGVIGNGDSRRPTVSGDGSRVAFQSSATNLIASDGNGEPDVFVRKRDEGKTVRASEADGGGDTLLQCFDPVISANGQYVVFVSRSDDITPNAFLGSQNIFRRDLEADLTELVSVNTIGEEPSEDSGEPSVSADGLRVAFSSVAPDLSSDPDVSPFREIYVSDLTAPSVPVVTRISRPFTAGIPLNGQCSRPAISGDGSRVAFVSQAMNLLETDLNGSAQDIIVADVAGGPLVLASRHTSGPQGNQRSLIPQLSHSGRYLVFNAESSNLVDDDFNGLFDVFWRDLQSAKTVRISVGAGGAEGNLNSGSDTDRVAISADGRRAWFVSGSTNLIPQDVNGVNDIFERGPLY